MPNVAGNYRPKSRPKNRGPVGTGPAEFCKDEDGIRTKSGLVIRMGAKVRLKCPSRVLSLSQAQQF